MTDPYSSPSSPPPYTAWSPATERTAGTIPTVWTRAGARVFDELLIAVPRLALTVPFLELDEVAGLRYDPPKWVLALAVIIPILYDFAFVAIRSATPGKSLFGVVVRSASDGGRVSANQAALRSLVPSLGSTLALALPLSDVSFLLAMVAPVVYASVMWDQRRRGLHDKAAGTIVLRTDA